MITLSPPQLYNETQKRKELIREVEMGPFKHEVDDGLDLRKVLTSACSVHLTAGVTLLGLKYWPYVSYDIILPLMHFHWSPSMIYTYIASHYNLTGCVWVYVHTAGHLRWQVCVLSFVFSFISWILLFYRLDIFEFLSHVQDGLKDHYDIKMLTYLMVARWTPLI